MGDSVRLWRTEQNGLELLGGVLFLKLMDFVFSFNWGEFKTVQQHKDFVLNLG
jgi:hypothetical protein